MRSLETACSARRKNTAICGGFYGQHRVKTAICGGAAMKTANAPKVRQTIPSRSKSDANRGVVYVAYGRPAVEEASASIASLREYHDWPVCVVTGAADVFPGCTIVPCGTPGPGARRAKLSLWSLVPERWDALLYLDADTRVHGDLSAGFEIIEDGWDMAIAASEHQDTGWLWHASAAERQATERECGRPIQWQGGVWFAARNEAVRAFMSCWLAEWERWRMIDQGALMRALERVPVRLWALGRTWNGGELVEHRFGRARG